MTRSGFAPGLSILLTATTIGTPAARAWSMDSLVCGITPSSAATIKTTISVICAPRARIAVKAS
ncbi:secreted protein [gut metagenome]|uniref:Secreted protein n=1 Tax=gut metagenome TaxID=749906 RepID=J9CI69_9ZZZZ